MRISVFQNGQPLMPDQVFNKSPIRLGRMKDNDIVLPFSYVSRYHCEIRLEKGPQGLQWVIFNLDSKNGIITDINMPVTSNYVIEESSEFRIQNVGFLVEIEGAVAPSRFSNRFETPAISQLRDVTHDFAFDGNNASSEKIAAMNRFAPPAPPKPRARQDAQSGQSSGGSFARALSSAWRDIQTVLGLL